MTHMGLVPLTERMSIDLNDSTLDEGIRPDQFVVGSVVDLEIRISSARPSEPRLPMGPISPTDHTDQPSLPSDLLRCPSKVSSLQANGTVFLVPSSCPDFMDALGTQFGHGRRTSEFESSLLAVVCALGAGGRALVP